MKVSLLFLVLIVFGTARAQTTNCTSSSATTAEYEEFFQELASLEKDLTNPQAQVGTQILNLLPSQLVGDTQTVTQLTIAAQTLGKMFYGLWNISQQIPVQNITYVYLDSFCYAYNQLAASPLSAFVTFDNIYSLFEAAVQGALNTGELQPTVANFTSQYFTDNAPGAIRIALIPSGMVVSWQTLNNYSADLPAVMYGTSQNTSTTKATGFSHTYGTVWFHDVILPNLTPSTEYFYSIVSDVTNGTYNFFTAPVVGNNASFTATIIGDMGILNANDTYKSLVAAEATNPSDLYIHIGDISYADDYILRPTYQLYDQYEKSWNAWQQWMSSLTVNTPYMVLPGNHEATCQEALPTAFCPARTQNFTAFRHRFRMPSAESQAGAAVQNMWSSFDYGLAHFVMINTETDYNGAYEGNGTSLASGPFGGDITAKQLDWLEADLKKAVANRTAVPWIVVMGHRPVYTGTADLTNDPVTKAFEPLFRQYKVDIYLAGHIHLYERLYPIGNGVPQPFTGNIYSSPNYTTYIINGAAGNDERHSPTGVYNTALGAYVNNNSYGYGKLKVHNATHIQWQFVRSVDTAVDDELWIQKARIVAPTTTGSTGATGATGATAGVTTATSSAGAVRAALVLFFMSFFAVLL